MRRLVLFLMVFLVGCAGARGPTYAYQECYSAISRAPSYSSLLSKGAFIDSSNVSFTMRADISYPTQEERAQIPALADQMQECHLRFESLANSTPASPLRAPYERLIGIREQAMLSLYQGRLTWGQFNTVRAESGESWREALANNSSSQEEANRQLLIQALLNQPRPQPYQLPMPVVPPRTPTTTTNCYTDRYGYTSCTTH